MKRVLDDRLADVPAVLRSLADAMREVQDLPASNLRIIPDVDIVSGAVVTVPHRLGRRPRSVVLSVPRRSPKGADFGGAVGFLKHYPTEGPSGETFDPTKVVMVGAFAWGVGVAVRIDVWVL